MTFFVKALEQLAPGAQWTIHGEDEYENIKWIELADGQTKPTKEQIESKVEELKLEYERLKYRQQRSLEYPSIGDQLDSLFQAGVFPPEMTAKIQAVKDKYPKS